MALKDFQKVLDSNISVTEHFRLREFFQSDTAASCGIVNLPATWKHLQVVLTNINHIARFLQYLRQMVKKPIIITSGYRCPQLNKKVGGVFNSYHMEGMAVDIRCDCMETLHKYCLGLLRAKYDGYEVEYIAWDKKKNYIHIEFKKYV